MINMRPLLALLLMLSEACGGCPTGKTCTPTQAADLQGAPASDLAMVCGCASGSGEQFGTLWGCRGIWETGHARELCRPGFHVPTGANLQAFDAEAAQGFYMADLLASVGNPFSCLNTAVTCAPSTEFGRLRYGFGKKLGPEVEVDCQVFCGTFSRAFNCQPTKSTLNYNCLRSTGLDSEWNMEPMIGVLCAPD